MPLDALEFACRADSPEQRREGIARDFPVGRVVADMDDQPPALVRHSLDYAAVRHSLTYAARMERLPVVWLYRKESMLWGGS